MSKVKIGILGLWRGMEYVRQFHSREDTEVYALCDTKEDRRKEAVKICGPDVKEFQDFDEMLDSGIDAVVLCNYFHEHAAYAIRAMEKGVHVLSECTAAPTLAQCVALCEAVERTGCKYMLAENYPFSPQPLEMARLCRDNVLGRIVYAEAEYNHSAPLEGLKELTPGKNHWRAWLPRTYYLTHSLGPLMTATGQTPVQVSGFAVHSDVLQQYDDFRHNYDALAMMNCITDSGALFRLSGCTTMPAATHSCMRIVGENGSAETGRTLGNKVDVHFQPWLVPEGMHQDMTYLPEDKGQGGHGGSDYWVAAHFAEYLIKDVKPFFDVYRACTMSAVGILGWRSCLENGKVYKIPDFTDAAQRELCRNDDLTPFPGEDQSPTLPCALPQT